LRAADIEGIRLFFPKDGIHCIDDNPLKSHCAQYILPVALVNRGLQIADIFVDRRVSNPELAALCRKVRVESDPELDRLFPDFYASRIELRTTDGRRLVRRNDIARGYPETPMTHAELDEKFRALAGSVCPPTRVAALAAALDGLPEARDLSALAEALGAVIGVHQ
jgi:2-methylcitrate dehydratase PrpD